MVEWGRVFFSEGVRVWVGWVLGLGEWGIEGEVNGVEWKRLLEIVVWVMSKG